MGFSPYLAEMCIFPFNFAPVGWAFCDGQLLSISSNTPLFSLLGITYGGNGTSTFALPNLQGAVPIHVGQGPGLQSYVQGQTGGSDTVTLLSREMPTHTHSVTADGNHLHDTLTSPSGGLLVNASPNLTFSTSASPTVVQMNPSMVGVAGNSSPHNNLMPYLALNYCIALQGAFPPRS